MIRCPVCAINVKTTRLECEGCHVALEGVFELPRLARLPVEHQNMAEALVLSGGNLKRLAQEMNISYPTLRKRLDDLIAALEGLRKADEGRAEDILKAIETGAMTAEQGLRQIKELNGEL